MYEPIKNLAVDLITIDQYTTVVIVCAVISALWILRTMTESTALTLIFSPTILLGALAANYLFRVNFVVAINDKDTNVVVASAVGVLAALVLMLIAARIAIILGERKMQNRANQPILVPVAGGDIRQE